ncbi:hypothetical protein HDU76_013954 [Blyttiomyces sp. JEL0837]|nr:hypothetical protein HDU76_013954 [Blyttiomyces sp. JEL0837]
MMMTKASQTAIWVLVSFYLLVPQIATGQGTGSSAQGVILGYPAVNVTGWLQPLSQCTKDCYTQVPGFTLPYTMDTAIAFCTDPGTFVNVVTSCVARNFCDLTELQTAAMTPAGTGSGSGSGSGGSGGSGGSTNGTSSGDTSGASSSSSVPTTTAITSKKSSANRKNELSSLFTILLALPLLVFQVTRADDVIIGGFDITQIVGSTAPQTKQCMAQVPGFSFPVTYEVVDAMCAEITTILDPLTLCMTTNGSPDNDLSMVGLLPIVCQSLPATSVPVRGPEVQTTTTTTTTTLAAIVATTTEAADTLIGNQDIGSSNATSSTVSPTAPIISTTIGEVITTTVAPPPPPPPPVVAPTTTAVTSNDLFIMGYDVTVLIQKLSSCSKSCLDTISEVQLPLTVTEISSLCPNIASVLARMNACMVTNKCPKSEAVYSSSAAAAQAAAATPNHNGAPTAAPGQGGANSPSGSAQTSLALTTDSAGSKLMGNSWTLIGIFLVVQAFFALL